jgi:thymidylate synthase (FAD)
MVVTGNARALRAVLALRGSEHADAEFRRLAVIWTDLMKQLAPLMFKDFSIVGGCVHSEYGHV